MLRAILVCPNSPLRCQLSQLFQEAGGLGVVRSFDRYPDYEELAGFIRAHQPHVIFFDYQNVEQAGALSARLMREQPHLNQVAVNQSCDPGLLLLLMRVGVREFLAPPFDVVQFQELVRRLRDAVQAMPAAVRATDFVYSFLPAKPGCGASTLAVNVALAMARIPDMKVLLADFDLNSGMTRFLLKLGNAFSTHDALEKAALLDEPVWAELATRMGQLDVISAGSWRSGFRVETANVRYLLDFVRQRYKVILLDLSGAMEDYSLEVLSASKRIFLVTNPDILPVYMACERLRGLRSIELEDRVSVLVNRWHRSAVLPLADIESLLGVPVQQALSEDPQAVHKALLNGAQVDPGCDLGRDLAQLAHGLAEKPPRETEAPRRRLVEYFSIAPARYSIFPGTK